jgi:hypothetical protein
MMDSLSSLTTTMCSSPRCRRTRVPSTKSPTEASNCGVAKNNHRFCPPRSMVTSTLHFSGSVIGSSIVYGTTCLYGTYQPVYRSLGTLAVCGHEGEE